MNEETKQETEVKETPLERIAKHQKEIIELLANYKLTPPTMMTTRQCLTQEEIVSIQDAFRINCEEVQKFVAVVKDLLEDDVHLLPSDMIDHPWHTLISRYAHGQNTTLNVYAYSRILSEWMKEIADDFEVYYYKIFCGNYPTSNIKNRFIKSVIEQVADSVITSRVPY